MGDDHELKSNGIAYALDGAPYDDITRSGSHSRNSDVSKLARMGKRQLLKRRFGFLSLFGFSCTILITWETVLALFSEGFENGGPAGLVYGFLISWFCTLSVYTVIAEMASIAPIAGGQYFWVAILAPPGSRQFYSYIIGWLTTIAWVATLAVGSTYIGAIIQGVLILDYPSYSPTTWKSTLFSWLVILVCVFINTVVSSWLPKIEGFILIFHVLGFFAVLITIVYMSPHGTVSDVFLTSLNEGGFPTQGLSYCVGFIGNVATFVGADASVHMSEEIENAAVNVPRAIFTTMILNGALGFAIMVATLFCLGDVETVLNTPTNFPFIQIFYDSTQSVTGATVLSAIVMSLSWAGTIGFTATASRMLWSFARDKGVPFHRTISRVEPRTHIPVVAVGIVALIPALLALIYIGSPTVFNDVVSMSVSGFYASYFPPCALLLWRRMTGRISEPEDILEAESAVKYASNGDKLLQMNIVWGPWRVRGLFGTINNAFACLYMIFVIFWSFWPPAVPVTPANMNYSVLVTGAAILFGIVYYFAHGRTHYSGPLVEEDILSPEDPLELETNK